MTENERLRRMLESETPRLSPEAAVRLDAALGEVIERRSRRAKKRIWRPTLVAAPALLLILLAVLWLRPGPRQAEYLLLDEEQLLSALATWEDPDEALDALYSEDSVEDMSADNWNESDWEAFQADLESFKLADNGGES